MALASEEFVIDFIYGKKLHKNKHPQYAVKWAMQSFNEHDWEPQSNFTNGAELNLARFERCQNYSNYYLLCKKTKSFGTRFHIMNNFAQVYHPTVTKIKNNQHKRNKPNDIIIDLDCNKRKITKTEKLVAYQISQRETKKDLAKDLEHASEKDFQRQYQKEYQKEYCLQKKANIKSALKQQTQKVNQEQSIPISQDHQQLPENKFKYSQLSVSLEQPIDTQPKKAIKRNPITEQKSKLEQNPFEQDMHDKKRGLDLELHRKKKLELQSQISQIFGEDVLDNSNLRSRQIDDQIEVSLEMKRKDNSTQCQKQKKDFTSQLHLKNHKMRRRFNYNYQSSNIKCNYPTVRRVAVKEVIIESIMDHFTFQTEKGKILMLFQIAPKLFASYDYLKEHSPLAILTYYRRYATLQ